MPVYEYKCEKCNKVFEILASIREKEKGLKAVCPKCKGKRVYQIFRKINIVTSSKIESDDFSSDLGDMPKGDEGGGEESSPDLGDVGEME